MIPSQCTIRERERERERRREREREGLNVNPTYSRNILFLREPFVFFVLVTRDTYP